ncbi:MAG TPA: FtsX-like permease family protein [Bacteroidetes bacterium]|nr:FtsX-like permease family protein [Bacteroidota bacterium]
MQRILFNFLLAIEGVVSNTLRAILTALGIIFGVAAVIAMLAIGNGAKQSILDQMKLIGTNNIVIKSVVLKEGEEGEETANTDQSSNNSENGKRPWSPGLTLQDVLSFEKVLPNIDHISPEIVLPTNLIQFGKTRKAKVIGVNNSFFELNNLSLAAGNLFHHKHLEGGKPVCIIGQNVRKRFFPETDPLGQYIKCGKAWMKIIGVLEKRNASKESLENLGIRDYNSDVYIPIKTALLRIKNRARVTSSDIKSNQWDDDESEDNYHQLDKVVVRVTHSDQLKVTAEVIAKILKRRHKGLIDFEVEVPELLLEQQQKTQDMFNLVLAAIAGISLLVGGIGIMNIMLASVLERIKEIGVRRSLGATMTDIQLQFLFEAVFISLLGGLIGIGLGVLSANFIASRADIPTVVSAASIILSFGVAAVVGLVFGFFPARKAAKQDPIKALRTD